jgi:DNA-directed RNA polymerase subunit M/transcription elongation factor TFIIS
MLDFEAGLETENVCPSCGSTVAPNESGDQVCTACGYIIPIVSEEAAVLDDPSSANRTKGGVHDVHHATNSPTPPAPTNLVQKTNNAPGGSPLTSEANEELSYEEMLEQSLSEQDPPMNADPGTSNAPPAGQTQGDPQQQIGPECVCQACGSECPPGAKFCPMCGSALPDSSQQMAAPPGMPLGKESIDTTEARWAIRKVLDGVEADKIVDAIIGEITKPKPGPNLRAAGPHTVVTTRSKSAMTTSMPQRGIPN